MRFTARDSEDDDVVLDMTPMIDMVFQLLIFFLVTTTFSNTAGIEVNLPRATTREIKPQKEDLIIALTAGGQTVIAGRDVTLTDLRARLTELAKKDRAALVIIQADSTVHHGRVVEIMDLAKSVGLGRLAIATLAE